MGLVVNTNIASLQGKNVVEKNTQNMVTTMQKLSTGFRINSSKDDAAGLAVSEKLTSQINGNDLGKRNGNDAISMAQTAESALTEILGGIHRIRELAVQSSNAGLQDNDRSKIQTEVDQITQEISRIANTTEFNGKTLLNDTAGTRETSAVFQVGHSASTEYQLSFAYSNLNTLLTGLGMAGTSNFYNANLTATGSVNLGNSAQASALIFASDVAIDRVVTERTRYAAIQLRFDAAVKNMDYYNMNLMTGRSRIRDADFAMESTNLTRNQILQQSSTAMLSQANLNAHNVLNLLQG